MSPNCLIEKGNGRIEGFYEPELLDVEGLRSYRRVLRAEVPDAETKTPFLRSTSRHLCLHLNVNSK
jgi:hypothetical protein